MEQNEPAKVTYSEEDKKLLRETVFKGVSDFQFRQGWHIIEIWGIDLFIPGQFFVTPRKDRKNGDINYQFTVGHPVMIRIAHQLGMKTLNHHLTYEPTDVREEHPISDTVTITREDGAEFSKPTYFQDYYSGGMWDSKPHVMLEKCAEAATIRIAFKLSGLYIREEIGENMEDSPNPSENPPKKSAETSLPHNEFDLSRPSLDQNQIDQMIEDIRNDFGGQMVSAEELDCCRRSDGRYDLESASVLKRTKYNAFKGVA